MAEWEELTVESSWHDREIVTVRARIVSALNERVVVIEGQPGELRFAWPDAWESWTPAPVVFKPGDKVRHKSWDRSTRVVVQVGDWCGVPHLSFAGLDGEASNPIPCSGFELVERAEGTA